MHPVSVIIVNYNAGPLLAACVETCLGKVAQVIVVDNASSDTSLAAVESRFAGNDSLKIVRSRRNLGFARACNIGIGYCDQPFLLFFNPDCELQETALNRLLAVLQADARAGMVGGLLVDADGREQGGGRRAIPTPWRSFVRAFGLSRLSHRWPKLFFDFHLHKQALPTEPTEVEAISGACMLVKRPALQEVGPWDKRYFLHCEDLDWCMRFRQQGWKILFVPDAVVVHHKGACSRRRPIFVEWHKHRGMVHFYRKFFRDHYPGGLLMLVVAGVWLRFSALAVYHVGARLGGRLLGRR